jgi:hypothetical protein
MAVRTTFHTATATRAVTNGSTIRKRTNVRLWATQGALAALFAFAGAAKLVTPAGQLAAQSDFPTAFLYFIGAAELLGAIGLILPWALGIKPGLTPLAAAGLAVIMVGAAIAVAVTMNPAFAVINLVIAAVAISVVTGRRDFASRAR